MEVVHIIDTDGAFIDDGAVRYADTEDPQYFDDGIETKNVAGIISRNRRKSAIIERMLEIKNLMSKTIPYSVYYFSSNMDHVFHGNANMSRSMYSDV